MPVANDFETSRGRPHPKNSGSLPARGLCNDARGRVTRPMDVGEELRGLIERGHLGLGVIAADRGVIARRGVLSAWLPAEGSDCCACAVLTGMEDTLAALARGDRATIEIPGIQLIETPGAVPMTVTVAWSADAAHFVVMTTPEIGVRQVETLLIGERRARRLIEEQLAAGNRRIAIEQARYREIVETVDDFVLRLGTDRSVVFVNRRFVEFIGRDQIDLIGRPIAELAVGAGESDRWEKALASAEPSSFEQELVDPNGASRHIWWHVQRLETGGDSEFQLVGRDVTVIHQLRRAMAAAEAEARAAAVANERLRMARDLHDTLSHSLVALHAQIRLMRAVLKHAPERMAEVLGQAETAAAEGVARARAAILDIRDRQGDEDDPVRDLRGMAAAFAARTGIAAEVEISVERLGLSRESGDVALRIAEEALRNVGRHANATRVEMRVELAGDKRAVRVVIADNGAGFDPALRKPGHYGLVGIEEHVRAVGGSLDIESSPGKGTRLRVLLPVDMTGNEDPSSRTRAERTRPP